MHIAVAKDADVMPNSAKFARRLTWRDRGQTLHDPGLWLITGAAFGIYLTLSVCTYVTQGARSPDLAIFTSAVRGYATSGVPISYIGGDKLNLLGEHFHPIVAVLTPAFWLWPSPVMLLLAQSVLTALSIIPVYLAAAHHLGHTPARIVAVAYGLSWGLVQMVEFDFHEVAFAVPLLAFSLSALVRGKTTAAVAWAAPLVAVKENQGFTLVALGAVLAVVYRRQIAGALLAAWGAGWSLLAVYVLIPALNPDGEYPFWRDGGGPAEILAGMDVKMSTLVLVLLTTAFAALRSPLALVAVPSLALRFISTNENHWGIIYHYSAVLMPIMFIAAIDGLTRLRGRYHLSLWLRQHATAMMLITGVALSYLSPMKHLWDPETYQVTDHHLAIAEAVRTVPDGATVEASVTTLAPLATRTKAYYWDDDITPEWIVYDEESYEWDDADIETIARRHDVNYMVVYKREDVWVLRREV